MRVHTMSEVTNLYSNMSNNYYMQKQAAWAQAADDAMTKQAAGVMDFIKNNPELVGALLGGTAGAGIGAYANDDNRLLGALGGGALGAGVGAGGGYAARWLQNYLANRQGKPETVEHVRQGNPTQNLHLPRGSSEGKTTGAPEQDVKAPAGQYTQAETVDHGELPTLGSTQEVQPYDPLSLAGDVTAAYEKAKKVDTAFRRNALQHKFEAATADPLTNQPGKVEYISRGHDSGGTRDLPTRESYKSVAPSADVKLPSLPQTGDKKADEDFARIEKRVDTRRQNKKLREKELQEFKGSLNDAYNAAQDSDTSNFGLDDGLLSGGAASLMDPSTLTEKQVEALKSIRDKANTDAEYKRRQENKKDKQRANELFWRYSI